MKETYISGFAAEALGDLDSRDPKVIEALKQAANRKYKMHGGTRRPAMELVGSIFAALRKLNQSLEDQLHILDANLASVEEVQHIEALKLLIEYSQSPKKAQGIIIRELKMKTIKDWQVRQLVSIIPQSKFKKNEVESLLISIAKRESASRETKHLIEKTLKELE